MKKKPAALSLSAGKFIILPDPSLVGYKDGYVDRITNTVYVSPAIFELLQDPESNEQIIKQLSFVNLNQFTSEVVNDFIKRGAKEITYTGGTRKGKIEDVV